MVLFFPLSYYSSCLMKYRYGTSKTKVRCLLTLTTSVIKCKDTSCPNHATDVTGNIVFKAYLEATYEPKLLLGSTGSMKARRF